MFSLRTFRLNTYCIKTIATAKKEVYDFVDGIVQWVAEVKLAFASDNASHFTKKTWEYLAKMRYAPHLSMYHTTFN
jgi:hypothetical protein